MYVLFLLVFVQETSFFPGFFFVFLEQINDLETGTTFFQDKCFWTIFRFFNFFKLFSCHVYLACLARGVGCSLVETVCGSPSGQCTGQLMLLEGLPLELDALCSYYFSLNCLLACRLWDSLLQRGLLLVVEVMLTLRSLLPCTPTMAFTTVVDRGLDNGHHWLEFQGEDGDDGPCKVHVITKQSLGATMALFIRLWKWKKMWPASSSSAASLKADNAVVSKLR